MKVTIIGTGYVGLVTGTCLANMGNEVWCVDVDQRKIDTLNAGRIPIYEPGLAEMVARNREMGALHFTTALKEALDVCALCFIAVGTPMGEDGSSDLRYVMAVAKSIGETMSHPLIVVDKSTVPVGTAEKVRAAIQTELDRRNSDLTFHMVSNPEFLKEGSAVEDCMKPDRIVLGTDCEESAAVMRELYKPFVRNAGNLIFMDIPSAEMTKYAANCMLAMKISFINEIANICERVGADVNLVRVGIGSDKRIGYSFIYPGCGYGGSCFPKDVRALTKTAEEFGYDAEILRAVDRVNEYQKTVLVRKVLARFGEDLTGKTFAVWGLAFKPDTDDMRESAAVPIIRSLVEAGASIQAYDPKATEAARSCYLRDVPQITYCESKYEALHHADALLLITEWKEFRSPDFEEIKKQLKTPVIFDGRNQYDKERQAAYGIEYHQIGVRRTEEGDIQ